MPDIIESFDQKYIPKNIINGIPKPKRIYFGIDVFNLFAWQYKCDILLVMIILHLTADITFM